MAAIVIHKWVPTHVIHFIPRFCLQSPVHGTADRPPRARPVRPYIGIWLRALTWFGHVIRWKGSLANMLLQRCTDGCRKRGRPVRMWLDNIKDWIGLNFHQLIRTAENRELWSSCVSSVIKMLPKRPLMYGT